MIWPALYVFAIHPADHIGAFFKAVFALCALASGVFAMSALLRIWRIFRASGDWKATIGAGRLVWDVAIPSKNLPLDVELGQIAKALRLETSQTSKDSDGEYTETRERFELHLTDDRILIIDREAAGMDPHRVFLALSQYGIRYELWLQDCTKGSVNTSKMFQRCY
nr:hypothetical protein [Ruegeria arenilitoris]